MLVAWQNESISFCNNLWIVLRSPFRSVADDGLLSQNFWQPLVQVWITMFHKQLDALLYERQVLLRRRTFKEG
jgi:hypothetical protein